MSIPKSFNKHTNTWYAYDTTYVFDEALGRKVQKRKCIGKFDPATQGDRPERQPRQEEARSLGCRSQCSGAGEGEARPPARHQEALLVREDPRLATI